MNLRNEFLNDAQKRLLISGKLDENCFEAAISRQNYPLLTLIFFLWTKKDKWNVYRLLTLKKTCNLWINGILTPTNFNIFTYKKTNEMFTDCYDLIYSVFSRLFLSKYFKRKRGTIFSWFQLETAWSCFISTQTSSVQKSSKVWTKINYGVIFKLKQICQIFIVE